MPKLDDARMLQGNTAANVGTAYSAGLPNIYGTVAGFQLQNTSDVFSMISGGTNHAYNMVMTNMYNLSFSADRNNAIYGASSTVQPVALDVIFIIKYSKG